MSALVSDVRFAVRIFVRAPAITLWVILALALGIGANSAMFSVFEALLLHPANYTDPSQIVLLWERDAQGVERRVSAANVLDWRAHSQSFSDIAGWAPASYVITGADRPQEVGGATVTSNLFRMLGVKPWRGRTFRAEDGARHAARTPDSPAADRKPALGLLRRIGGPGRGLGADPHCASLGASQRHPGVHAVRLGWHGGAVYAGRLAAHQHGLQPGSGNRGIARGFAGVFAGRGARLQRLTRATALPADHGRATGGDRIDAGGQHLSPEPKSQPTDPDRPGFDLHNVLIQRLYLPLGRYDAERALAFHRGIVERMNGLAGVESATASSNLPLHSITMEVPFDREDSPAHTEAERAGVGYVTVAPGYFETLRIPLRTGRSFTTSDHQTAPVVVLVNDALVECFFRRRTRWGSGLL